MRDRDDVLAVYASRLRCPVRVDSLVEGEDPVDDWADGALVCQIGELGEVR